MKNITRNSQNDHRAIASPPYKIGSSDQRTTNDENIIILCVTTLWPARRTTATTTTTITDRFEFTCATVARSWSSTIISPNQPASQLASQRSSPPLYYGRGHLEAAAEASRQSGKSSNTRAIAKMILYYSLCSSFSSASCCRRRSIYIYLRSTTYRYLTLNIVRNKKIQWMEEEISFLNIHLRKTIFIISIDRSSRQRLLVQPNKN